MTITVSPVTPEFVAEVFDVDLSRAVSDADFAEVARAFWKYSVLVFPGQKIDQSQQLAFAERFGAIERERTLDPKATPSRFDGAFSDISNLTFEDPANFRAFSKADIVFSALPHHASMEIAPDILKNGKQVGKWTTYDKKGKVS